MCMPSSCREKNFPWTGHLKISGWIGRSMAVPCLLSRCTVLVDSIRTFPRINSEKRNSRFSCSSLHSSSLFLSPFRLFSPCFSRMLWVQASFALLRLTPSKSPYSFSSSSLSSTFLSSSLLCSTSSSYSLPPHLFFSSSVLFRNTSSSSSSIRAMSSSSSSESARPDTHIPPDPPPPASLFSPSSDRKKRAREEEKEKEEELSLKQDATQNVIHKKDEQQSSLSPSLLTNEASKGGEQEEEGEQERKKLNTKKEEEKRGKRRIAPLSIVTWNVNSLPSRIRQPWLWIRFVDWLHAVEPDVLCLQEVKMAAQGPPGAKRGDGMPREQNKMKTTDRSSSAEAKDVNEAISEALPGHVCLISLADWKYSGQMMFLKKDLYVRSVRFNLSLDSLPPDKHDPEGRVIAADFEPFVVLTTYSPNNGGNKKSFERRRLWDERMKKFVQGVQKPLIWVGDLNCAPEDVDLSDPERFRSVIHEEPGEPIDPDNIGQAGCTDAERRRFASILQAGDLVDAFRVLNPRKEPPSLESAEYSWRGWGGRGPRALFKGLGMRLDHVILSESLMKAVEDVRICGSGTQMRNFFGSDHCPVLLRLKEEVACALPSFESDAFSPAHSVTAAVGGSSKTKGLANYWASKGENRSAQPKAKTEDVVVLSDSSADGEKDGKRKGK